MDGYCRNRVPRLTPELYLWLLLGRAVKTCLLTYFVKKVKNGDGPQRVCRGRIAGILPYCFIKGRPRRTAEHAAKSGPIHHTLNRAIARMTVLEADEDDESFENDLAEA